MRKSSVARQAMYVLRNIQKRSQSHCCHGKAISITHSERVPVAFVIQHATRMRRIISSSVSDFAIFFHYLVNGTIFGRTNH
jgi:hypothetical protein